MLIGVIAVLSGAYLAAVFLAGDSRRARQPDLVRAFRARALGSGALTGVVALGGLFVLRDDSPALYDGLTSGGGLAMVVVSALAGAVTLALVWSERYGLARLTSALAVAAIVVGWALAQDPYFLPGELTLERAAAPDAVLGDRAGLDGRRRADPRAVAVVALPPHAAGPPRQGLRAPRPAVPPVKLVALMFTCLGAGLLLMLLFEAWFTRLLGVAALFAFIVVGRVPDRRPGVPGRRGRRGLDAPAPFTSRGASLSGGRSRRGAAPDAGQPVLRWTPTTGRTPRSPPNPADPERIEFAAFRAVRAVADCSRNAERWRLAQ